jgi:DNA-directed RNA polymerase subunit F
MKIFKKESQIKIVSIAIIIIFLAIDLGHGADALRVPIVTVTNKIRIIEQCELPPLKNINRTTLKALGLKALKRHKINRPVYKKIFSNNKYIPTCKKNRKDLVFYTIYELAKNLEYYSNLPNKLLFQHIYIDDREAIRIISKNVETIKDPMSYILGNKIEENLTKASGIGLYFLKEFAYINKDVFFIMDTDGIKINVSYENIAMNIRGLCPGTEIQMIILIPDSASAGIEKIKKRPCSDL